MANFGASRSEEPVGAFDPRGRGQGRGLGNMAQRRFAMTDNSVVRARIDERTKKEAAAVLKTIGLTVGPFPARFCRPGCALA
jgi:hypothetical protein